MPFKMCNDYVQGIRLIKTYQIVCTLTNKLDGQNKLMNIMIILFGQQTHNKLNTYFSRTGGPTSC